MASDDESIENLSKIFQEGLDLFNNIDKTDEPTNSSEVQANVKRAMGLFEKATKLASLAGLFSVNESIDEVSTSDLQYMLMPALLGTLSLKITNGDRKEIVDVAEIYFKDFLQRCNDYGLSDYTFKDAQASSSNQVANMSELAQLSGMVHTRHNKIQRFKEQKELQSKLNDLKLNMANKNVDDEIKRQYILTMVKIFIFKSIEELDSIEMEKPMLAHMELMKNSDNAAKVVKKEPVRSKPLRPVIITKDDVQKAVFGLGYPSLPTLTVKEFYDQRVRDGVFPDPTKAKSGPPRSLQEAALAGVELDDEPEVVDEERRIENDDAEMLQRMRDKDEYKDEHRRGWGNRMNRS
ncbi:Two A-associated protein of 42kDa [Carabus blaptoides fortunei]